MNQITFIVPGILPGWQRAGKSGKRHFTEEQTAAVQREVAAWARQASQGRVLRGPLGFQATFYRPIAASLSAAKKTALAGAFCPTKPDADNLVKTIMDALNGVIWSDDAQVAQMTIEKRYSPLPRTDISVWECDVIT